MTGPNSRHAFHFRNERSMNHDPQMRATLRWFGLIVLVGIGLLIGLVFMLRTPPTPAARPSLGADLSRGPHELVPDSGVYYLGSDTSYGYTASYALRSPEGILVIDPGLRYDILVEMFQSLGLNPADVKHIVITHRHADHWFCVRELVAKTGAVVHAHAAEIPVLTAAADLRNYYSIYAQPLPDVPVLAQVQPLHDGDILRVGHQALEVLATPGHTPGSLCFRTTVNGYTLLFSGDTLMTLSPFEHGGDYMTRLGPKFGGDAQAYIATYERLRDTPFDLLLPGHPLLGKDFDPEAGAVTFRRTVDAKIAVLRERITARTIETRVFLDGTPKPIVDQIYYLGDSEGTAGYAVATSDGVLVFDPGRRSLDQLQTQFEALGLNLGDVAAVLLTGVSPQHAAGARAVCELTGAPLWCGLLNDSPQSTGAIRPDRQLKSLETIEFGGVRIRVFAGLPNAGADLCYALELSGRTVLVSGDSITRFSNVPPTPHADVEDAVKGNPASFAESAKQLRELPVTLLLPAHPQADDSPFFTREEWEERMTGE